jgi:serine/threonine protein kinase/WD40 repeat protein
VRIGRFELRRQLGKGGCGIVFLAYDPKLKREVALKIPRPEMLLSEETRKRLIREARAAAEFDHPNLVPVYETGEFGPLCYIASTFCPGPTLGQWLERQPYPVPVRQAARLVAIVAEAVQHAHDRGVLHRDLKPNNIILQPVRDDPLAEQPPVGSCQLRGEYYIPRVVDFGLAKLMERGEPSDTHTCQILGTPRYMAPEQALARHQDLGPAADVYGLGAILYELLTGCAPFDGATDAEVLRQVIDGQLRMPRQIRPDIPRDLEAICLKAMEKNPARRYRTAIDLADDLRRFLDGKPTIARPLNWLGRFSRWARRNDQLVALIVVTAIAVVMIGVGSWYIGETRRLKNDQQRTRSDLEQRSRYERHREYARYMYAAYLSLRSGNREEARDYLEAARLMVSSLNEPPDFPLLYLGRLVRSPRLDIPAFHSPVLALAVDANGRWLCWIDRKGDLTLWDLENNVPWASWQLRLSNPTVTAGQLAFVGPQPHIFWVQNERADTPQAKLWRIDLDNKAVSPTQLPEIFQRPCKHCATSGDGRFSCVHSADQQLLCWDWYQQKVVAQAQLAPTVRRMVIAGLDEGWQVLLEDTQRRLWRWTGQQFPQQLPICPTDHPISALTLTRQGQPLVATDQGVWILHDGQRWQQLASAPSQWFIPMAQGWVTSSQSGRFRWQNGSRSVWEWFVTVELGEVTAAIPDSSGRVLATASTDGFIRTWRVPDDIAALGVLPWPGLEKVWADAASSRLILQNSDYRCYQWTSAASSVLPHASQPVADAAVTSEGTLEVVFTEGASVRLERWSNQQRQRLGQWQLPENNAVVYARWVPRLSWLLTGNDQGQTYLWKVAESDQKALIIPAIHKQPLNQAQITSDGELLGLRWGSMIGIWSMSERAWRTVIVAPEGVSDFCFVEELGAVATAGERGVIRFWSIESGRETMVLLGHIGAATALAVSFDQRTLASGGANGEVILWDLRAQREVYRHRRHSASVRQIVFANQGRWLITVAADELAIWPTQD